MIILLVGLCLCVGLVCLIFSSLITSCLWAFFNSIRAILISFCRCACNVNISNSEKPLSRGPLEWLRWCSCKGSHKHGRCGQVISSSNCQNYHHGETILDNRSVNIFYPKSPTHQAHKTAMGCELITESEEPMIRPNSGSALLSTHKVTSSSNSSSPRYILANSRADSASGEEKDDEDSESRALMSNIKQQQPSQLIVYHPYISPDEYSISCTLRADARGLNGDHLYECIPEDAYNSMSMSSAFSKPYHQLSSTSTKSTKKMKLNHQPHQPAQHTQLNKLDVDRCQSSSVLNMLMSNQSNLHPNLPDQNHYHGGQQAPPIFRDTNKSSLISFTGTRNGSARRTSSPRAERRVLESASLTLGNVSHDRKGKNVYAKLHGNQVISSAIHKDI